VHWLVDECVDAGLATLLRALGHDVVYMVDFAPRTVDELILGQAEREGRLLLTEDKDFGDLIFRHGRRVPGLVLVRIEAEQRLHKGQRLRAAIDRFGNALFGHYTVVEVARFRSRPLQPQ
jgi:predicted nuclease of predicted toxin-antitoxin system